MPSFLSDLRRRSRNSNSNSFRSEQASTDSASNSGGSHDDSNDPPTKASSFSNLVSHFKSSTDASTIPPNSSVTSVAKTPPLPGNRPSMQASHSSRHSVSPCAHVTLAFADPSKGSPSMASSPRMVQHTSPLAPIANSIIEGSWVRREGINHRTMTD